MPDCGSQSPRRPATTALPPPTRLPLTCRSEGCGSDAFWASLRPCVSTTWRTCSGRNSRKKVQYRRHMLPLLCGTSRDLRDDALLVRLFEFGQGGIHFGNLLRRESQFLGNRRPAKAAEGKAPAVEDSLASGAVLTHSERGKSDGNPRRSQTAGQTVFRRRRGALRTGETLRFQLPTANIQWAATDTRRFWKEERGSV